MTDPVINTPVTAPAPTVESAVKADVKAERATLRNFIAKHPFEVLAYAVVAALVAAAFLALAL